MDAKELETYQVQLSQVEVALEADPDNDELQALKAELKELIDLASASLAPKPEPTASSSSKKPVAGSSNAAPSFAAGDEVLAKYSGDSSWYPARVTSVGGAAENRVYSVVFKGYNNTELLNASSIKAIPPSYNAAAGAAPSNKRKLSKEEEEEKERKKKKNEKKVEVRAAKAKEQNDKQATWQKFTKKSEKKGIHIAGVSGTSIFKTPDNPHGRVGVTGSGKGMTETIARAKHKFATSPS